MNETAAPPPSGYHILLPPGWRGFPVNDAGRTELLNLVGERCREMGRPNLDAQLRRLVREQWSSLQQQRARQVYMRTGEDGAQLLPMTIAVRQLVGPKGHSFASALAGITGLEFEQFDTPVGTWHKGQREQRGRGELEAARSVLTVYGLPMPPPYGTRGVVFIGGVTYIDETDDEMVEVHVELLDTIMETVRWRS